MFSNIKKLLLIILAVMTVMTVISTAEAKTPEERIHGAVSIIKEMATQEDAESMAYVLNRAKGVAIFPSVVKAGLVIGGQYGEGLLLKKDSGNSWYGPSFVNIAGASWGLQIGAQSVALVLVITNDRGMEQFMKGDQFKLGGDIAIAAGPVGRQGSAATDINLKASIYSYSMSKGLFAGITLEGSEVEVDENANTVYWGTATSPEKALSRKASSSKIKQLTGEIEKLMRLSR
jgi:lipid-binding SYLF domain-containing protein